MNNLDLTEPNYKISTQQFISPSTGQQSSSPLVGLDTEPAQVFHRVRVINILPEAS
jgi:hypothetical protein